MSSKSMVDFEQLRELIQAMNAQEQQYFRRQAGLHALHGRNRYLDLFDALAAHQTPAEAYSRSFVHYLQSIVLRALRQYHHAASADMELRATLDELEIVFEKGQFKLAERLLQQGMHLAEAVGEPWARMALLKWRRRMLRRVPQQKRAYAAIATQEAETLQQCQHEVAAIAYHDRMYVAARGGEWPSIDEKAPMMGADASFDAALALATGRGIAARLMGDTAAELQYFRENLEVWYSFPRKISDHPRRFTAALINYLRAGHGQNNFEGYAAVLERIQQLHFPHAARKLEIQVKCLNLVLVQHLNAHDLAAAAPVVQELTALIMSGKKSSLSSGTAYNLGVYHFLSGEHKAARKALSRLTQSRRSPGEQSARDAAMLFEVLIAMEQGDDDLAASLVRSRLRVSGRVVIPEWQVLLYQHLAAALKPLGRRRRQAHLQHAALQLEALPSVQGAGYQEVMLWLRAQVAGVTVRKLLGQA